MGFLKAYIKAYVFYFYSSCSGLVIICFGSLIFNSLKSQQNRQKSNKKDAFLKVLATQ